jgi:2-isopropylmalate synthase
MRSALGETAAAPFVLDAYRVITEHRADGQVVAEATVKVFVGGERVLTTAEGNGPVNALDAALRAALAPACPWLADVALSDYKVRILTRGTDAVTRVLVESTDRGDCEDRRGAGAEWPTVGVHGNVVEASWLALVDALAYAALRRQAPLAAAAG